MTTEDMRKEVEEYWAHGAKAWKDLGVGPNCWKVQIGEPRHATVIAYVADGSETLAWQAAYAFTVEHKERVRQAKAYIEWLGSFRFVAMCPEDELSRKRVLALAERELETLMKGVRGDQK